MPRISIKTKEAAPVKAKTKDKELCPVSVTVYEDKVVFLCGVGNGASTKLFLCDKDDADKFSKLSEVKVFSGDKKESLDKCDHFYLSGFNGGWYLTYIRSIRAKNIW